ncbi:MAG: hypothetical protein KatS3mg051_1599 [Anaerolineae bacterium]|nr:MAG: hypothetical protein KatS3mg051_1599 [Anaerolineae bacterium]
MTLIPLDAITDSPYQTRRNYDEAAIRELADSIAQHGLLHIPIGRVISPDGKPVHPGSCLTTFEGRRYWDPPLPHGSGRYAVQLAVGHSRLRAIRLLSEEGRWPEYCGTSRDKRPAMPVHVLLLSDEQMDLMAWAENRARADLTPIEEAQAIRDRIERRGWTQEEAAEHLGLARSTVANKLRLLRLPDEVLGYVADGSLSERQALALLPIFDLTDEEQEMLQRLREESRSGFVQHSPEHMIELLREGHLQKWSSDAIRRTVESKRQWLATRIEMSKARPAPRHTAEEIERMVQEEMEEAGMSDAAGEMPADRRQDYLDTLLHTSVQSAQSSLDCWLSDPDTYGGRDFLERVVDEALQEARRLGKKTLARMLESKLSKLRQEQRQTAQRRMEEEIQHAKDLLDELHAQGWRYRRPISEYQGETLDDLEAVQRRIDTCCRALDRPIWGSPVPAGIVRERERVAKRLCQVLDVVQYWIHLIHLGQLRPDEWQDAGPLDTGISPSAEERAIDWLSGEIASSLEVGTTEEALPALRLILMHLHGVTAPAGRPHREDLPTGREEVIREIAELVARRAAHLSDDPYTYVQSLAFEVGIEHVSV